MLHISVLVHLFHMAVGVIYHLNETDHNQMPSIFTLDDYDSCLADTGGTYCVAQFELHSNPGNYLLNRIKEYSEVSSKHYNYSRLDKGICVTKSCINFLNKKDLLKSEDLRLTLEECINNTMFSEYGLQAKLNHVYHCDRYKEEKIVDLLDRIVAALCLGLLFVNIIATFADHVYRKENIPNFVYDCLSCFSIQQNWKRFRDESTPDQFLSLKGLHGARSITMFLIVYAHMILLIAQYTKDTRYFEESYDHKLRTLLFSGLLLIQVFFGISGFLAAYLLQIKSKEKDIVWIDIPKVIFLRWWRFTPVNGLLIAFIMTWLRHLGSGPLWKLYVSDCPTAACRQHWWTHLLYINNYVHENLNCVFHTWYLAADMQLLILGLVVHVATRRRGRALALGILTVIGTLAPVLHLWLYDLDPQAMLRPEFLRTFQDDTFDSTHIQAHSNMVCFIMGMAAGYLGYYLQKRGTDLSRNKICRALPWLVIPAIIGLMYHSSMYFADEPRASVASRMLQAGAHRPIIGALAAIWCLALICKCNDASKALFEWRGWELTSKLSFCVYLVHIIFVYIILGLRKEVIPVSFLYMVWMTFLVLGMSFLVALPLHLMVEVPFNRLLKMLFINHAPLKKKM